MFRQHQFMRSQKALGFSLIEVLFAVVVLSVGLLVLAGLQAALIRSAGDTRAQTAALSLGEQKVEEFLAFADGEAYRSVIVPRPELAAETIADKSGNRGGINFQRWWSVNRYVFDHVSARFVDLGAEYMTASNAEIEALNSTKRDYDSSIGFKQITVTLRWYDATGAARAMTASGSVSAIAPGQSANVLHALAPARRIP